MKRTEYISAISEINKVAIAAYKDATDYNVMALNKGRAAVTKAALNIARNGNTATAENAFNVAGRALTAPSHQLGGLVSQLVHKE